MEMAKSSTKKSVRYRQSPVITFLVVAAVIFICVTSIVRATSLHTKSKQLAETEKTMELKVEEAKQEQANLDAPPIVNAVITIAISLGYLILNANLISLSL